MPAITVPNYLSCMPAKRLLFSKDPAFCQAWKDVQDVWGSDETIKSRLWHHAPIVFKPETILAGKLNHGLALLRSVGAEVVAAKTFTYTVNSVHTAWHYQINIATPERVLAMEQILTATESLYLIARYEAEPMSLPATIKLTDLKGPATPAKRLPEHLRARMNDDQDLMLNYLHTADEPADFVRELGVLFPSEVRKSLLQSVLDKTVNANDWETLVRHLSKTCPPRDLSLTSALRSVEYVLSERSTYLDADTDTLEEMASLCSRLKSGQKGLWPRLQTLLRSANLFISDFDSMIIACRTNVKNLEGETALLESCELSNWRDYVKKGVEFDGWVRV